MPSRLSSLLVRDGVVGIKVLERVFQRQVLYGGSLDTNLLEMKAAPEEQLLQYASLAAGVPPATRSDLEKLDPAAAERCPLQLARSHAVVPLATDRETLQVLVTEPVDLGELENLASELGVSLQPLLVLEYRFHVAWERLYGDEADSRFAKLAARLAREAAPVATSMRPESVVIDSPALRREKEERKRQSTRRRPSSQPAHREARTSAMATAGAGARAAPAEAETPATPPAAETAPAEAETPATPPAAETAPAEAETPATPAPRPTPAGQTREGDGPLGPDDARLLLESAAHRDDVFAILLRALRSQTSYAALLTVQGGAAIGRVAIADEPSLAERVGDALIPLDVRSAFKQVIESGAPYIGPVGTGDPEVDPMIERLGGCVPRAAMLLPITLRGRVVAVAFGHRGTRPLEVSEVSGILPVAGAAADALHRLIMSRKGASHKDGAREIPEPVADDPQTAPIRRPGNTATDQSAASLAEPIEALLNAIALGDEGAAGRARERAAAAPEDTISALAERFPGPLEVDRHRLGGRLRPAPEHGPLLALVVDLGAVVSPLIIGELQSEEPAHRYYAALCAGATQPRAALPALVDCIFDADRGVRAAAIEAIASYPQNDRDGALSPVREALAEIDEARVGAAAKACAELAHAPAIPALIEALSHETAPGPVRRALVSLTKQDFGGSSRKWRSWWNKNREKSRIEWMIEGLGHKEADVRRSAIEELRRLTGEYFGYHHDLPRKERNEAQKRWSRWWQESGRETLAGAAHERLSTALMPARE